MMGHSPSLKRCTFVDPSTTSLGATGGGQKQPTTSEKIKNGDPGGGGGGGGGSSSGFPFLILCTLDR